MDDREEAREFIKDIIARVFPDKIVAVKSVNVDIASEHLSSRDERIRAEARAAIIADHVPNAGKMMARAEDVETVRKDFEMVMDKLGFVKPEMSKSGNYKNPRTQQWFSMFRNGYYAALDRIVGKEE